MRTKQSISEAKATLRRLVDKGNELLSERTSYSQVSFRYGRAELEVRGADWMIGLLSIAIISMPLWI